MGSFLLCLPIVWTLFGSFLLWLPRLFKETHCTSDRLKLSLFLLLCLWFFPSELSSPQNFYYDPETVQSSTLSLKWDPVDDVSFYELQTSFTPMPDAKDEESKNSKNVALCNNSLTLVVMTVLSTHFAMATSGRTWESHFMAIPSTMLHCLWQKCAVPPVSVTWKQV